TLSPSEILFPDPQRDFFLKYVEKLKDVMYTPLDDWIYSYDFAYEVLIQHFNTSSLKGFGCQEKLLGIRSAGALLNYLKESKQTEIKHVTSISSVEESDWMWCDSTTLRNLEVFQSLMEGGEKGTLIHILDRTLTPMGGRMLRRWLTRPLKVKSQIDERLDLVAAFFEDGGLRKKVRNTLSKALDLERLISRLSTGRGNARDLIGLKNTLNLANELMEILSGSSSPILREYGDQFVDLREVTDKIELSIVEDPPISVTEGGIIKEGYDENLDQLRSILRECTDWIANLQRSERDRTAIPSLKVGYNRVFGYYIEITKPHLKKVPDDYIRKQTLVNAERFIVPELKEREEKILATEENIASVEREIFERIRDMVVDHSSRIQWNSEIISKLDCFSSLAEVAAANSYVRPEINESGEIVIKGGRHPVVERLLPPGDEFIPNDLELGPQDKRILIITGPNMAGKSTYLRQVGLIVLMAQMGSFVPAVSAEIGIVDRIFTRVGASDNIAAGESTFLAEMNETAKILHNATPESLIILDEIGRGTSTYDGMSIAWAITEYIHNNKDICAKTLFATHYHELTELESFLSGVKNYNVSVKEFGDKIVFLRKIVQGGCDHSYGIHVAQLAGLPVSVIKRSKEILHNLEMKQGIPQKAEISSSGIGRSPGDEMVESQLDIFHEKERRLREKLSRIDINKMTPLEALAKLEELKRELGV
ncbi:MAG: DNA mismatch repair protein MutS, partial [Fidelibacterota bacterium]